MTSIEAEAPMAAAAGKESLLSQHLDRVLSERP